MSEAVYLVFRSSLKLKLIKIFIAFLLLATSFISSVNALLFVVFAFYLLHEVPYLNNTLQKICNFYIQENYELVKNRTVSQKLVCFANEMLFKLLVNARGVSFLLKNKKQKRKSTIWKVKILDSWHEAHLVSFSKFMRSVFCLRFKVHGSLYFKIYIFSSEVNADSFRMLQTVLNLRYL